MKKTSFHWQKFLVLWICFLLLHYSYKWFPIPLFYLLGGDEETVFLHMKMLFVVYVLVNTVEFILVYNKVKDKGSHLSNRALIAVSYPWLTITFWFLARAFQIEFPVFWEIVYANLMVLLGFYIAIRLEELLDGVVVRPSLRWMSFLLLSAAVIVYVLFTYDPTYPFFTPPPGW